MKPTSVYTKKVLSLFKKPHNYGRMKNADGIGRVGNPVCLLPGQNVHMNNDMNEINAISREDRVLSHDGLYNFVDKIAERNYVGEILEVKNGLGKIKLTSEHLVLAIKIPEGDKFLRTKNRKKLSVGWYHINQLEKGDMVLYPILKEKKDLAYLKIDVPMAKWDFRSKEIPSKVPVNSEFLRLVGYFLAEGNIQDKPCKTYISFSLNIQEKYIVEDIKKISKDLFGLDATSKEKKKTKTVVVYLYSARLARFFKQLFGNGAEHKKLPEVFMNLPIKKQEHLICGLWRGDGCVNLNRDGARAGYSTVSYNLAQQLKTLLIRQKIVPSIYKEKAREINGVRHKESYRIHVGQRESLTRLCLILGIKYKAKSYASEKLWVDDDYVYTPITKITKNKYKGNVYNLEVKGSHSFVTEAFCLHNCGDVMWLYIKVGQNKKKQEIIKDIKFETFGCVAAISTSSIITDLAKGKTITEALEITKDNVVDSLGGLPKIKFHCSVLAVDALAEAIFDYLKKNKKEIPASLKKFHERNEV